MEILFKEHAIEEQCGSVYPGESPAAMIPAWSTVEAHDDCKVPQKHQQMNQEFVSPELLVRIKANIKSMYMNWIVQWRLGRAHVRESRRKKPPVVSPLATSLNRVLLSLGILNNFIFSWFWLGQFLQQRSTSLDKEKITSCSTVIFISFSFVHLFTLLSSKQEPKWTSTIFSSRTRFHFIFPLAHKIPSNGKLKWECAGLCFHSCRRGD